MYKQFVRYGFPVLRFLVFAGTLLYFVGKALLQRRKDRGYQCFSLTSSSREKLIRAYPPKFSVVEADHITIAYGVERSDKRPASPDKVEVIGYICDESLECVVVSVNGVYERPDGGIYHITLSRDWHRKSKESNDLIRIYGWIESDERVQLQATSSFRKIKE